MGASRITNSVMRIITRKMPCHRSSSTWRCGNSMRARKKPNSTQKNTTPSSFPEVVASTIFDGTMPSSVSRALAEARSVTFAVTAPVSASSASISRAGWPSTMPGLTRLLIASASSTAISVVTT